ncbi:MAG: PhzF family phenazine biosynthesis protein [Acidobacteriota bacterium]|nr:PhzF family phenazine biosynthesis protein [Acidobacteriota bacterium]
MTTPLFHVDAFTDRAFSGNPAAVCLLPEGSAPPDAWMQGVAREMNLSETAFLRKENGGWHLRWFTPAAEVDLCGHATLASAHVLWEAGFAEDGSTLDFETRSGRLSAARGRQDGRVIELDFPAEPAAPASAPPGLLSALGILSAKFTGRNRFDYLVEVAGEPELLALSPDFRCLRDACSPARGVIVTATSGAPEYDFVSRYFAPVYGIDEDPVTGSAHCCLGPFWGDRLSKSELTGYQASSRGGVVGVRLSGSRVILVGRAVTIARGELLEGDAPPGS